jgi:hypothetical protein
MHTPAFIKAWPVTALLIYAKAQDDSDWHNGETPRECDFWVFTKCVRDNINKLGLRIDATVTI